MLKKDGHKSVRFNLNLNFLCSLCVGMNGFGSVADGLEPVGNTVDDCRPGDPLFSMVG